MRRIATHPHVRLRAQVVDLIRLDSANQAGQVACVGQVTVVKEQTHAGLVPVLVNVLNAAGVEGR